jgi:hypothetical protein
MSDSHAKKKQVERMIADEFCVAVEPLLGKKCVVVRESESPDFLLNIAGREVGLELTAYYEQGPHNDA